MNWTPDPCTQNWALATHPQWPNMPSAQFAGNNMTASTWVKYILNASFPPYCVSPSRPNCLFSSPHNIIHCFSNKLWLEGVAMVVSWGTMSRTAKYIYRAGSTPAGLTVLLNVVDGAAIQIRASAPNPANWSINAAWQTLTSFGWSSVITSKCLHFLVRSSVATANPPVAMDRAAIGGYLWPSFEKRMRFLQINKPLVQPIANSWDGNGFAAYNRYMTAINVWANLQKWTTTDIETTIFDGYLRGRAIVWV